MLRQAIIYTLWCHAPHLMSYLFCENQQKLGALALPLLSPWPPDPNTLYSNNLNDPLLYSFSICFLPPPLTPPLFRYICAVAYSRLFPQQRR